MDKWTQHSKHFSAEKKAQLALIGSDYDKCIQATKEVFIDLNKDAANRQVYCHATCATDTSNISFVMSAVFDVILKAREGGGGSWRGAVVFILEGKGG